MLKLPTDLKMYQLVLFRNPATKIGYFVTITRAGRPINPDGRGYDHTKPIKYTATIDRVENTRSTRFKKLTMGVRKDSGKIPELYAQMFLKAHALLKSMGYEVRDRRWR